MKTYADLLVWQKSIDFVTEIYHISQSFPKDEMYGLTTQIRRSSVSIPSNIAEGFGRKYQKDFVRFLRVSMGSLFELQTQLRIAKNLQFIDDEKYISLFERTREIERMLSAFIQSIKDKM